MDDTDPSDAPADDYAVGYGRPPKSTQFKSGKSGNPRGRPKGVKSVGRLLKDALARRLTIQLNGQERSMGAQDLIIQGLVYDASRRDPKAVKLLFALIDRKQRPDFKPSNPIRLPSPTNC